MASGFDGGEGGGVATILGAWGAGAGVCVCAVPAPALCGGSFSGALPEDAAVDSDGNCLGVASEAAALEDEEAGAGPGGPDLPVPVASLALPCVACTPLAAGSSIRGGVE
mmetsp:Transcript_6433/g.13189  ORF Transcript_6433/g.13189 Transcript_6433/m.13189 type:complete len:110 (-) Transcript_6433:694-1023(-)